MKPTQDVITERQDRMREDVDKMDKRLKTVEVGLKELTTTLTTTAKTIKYSVITGLIVYVATSVGVFEAIKLAL